MGLSHNSSPLRARSRVGGISVLLADDHPLYLQGLCAVLGQMAGYEIVGIHGDGLSALHGIRQFQPKVAILGMSIAGLCGIELLKQVQHDGIATRVVLLASTQKDLAAAITHGPWGLLPKQSQTETVAKCMTSVADGERWCPLGLTDAPLRREAKWQNESEKIKSLLTKSELEVSLLIAEGLSNTSIARRMGISEGTVRNELYNAFRKIGGMNRPSFMTLVDRQQRMQPIKARRGSDSAQGSVARRSA
ncbi:MAG: response regulator transcription factor [Hyphomicrobiales bacterium]|nr:response regulator transcription factor [Hyphomicrobiales bacterium]